ncbi:MAG: hypothetical protein AABW89_05525 [Nanoarchaeota archaeon]
MNSINSIHEALINRGKIFTKKEIMNLFEEYKKIKPSISHKSLIADLSKNKYIKRIFLGYYYINSYDERKRGYSQYSDRELLFWVLNKEKIKWYLGLNTAIYEQGKTWQTPNKINIINTRISGGRRVVGLNIRFIKTKENLVFGLKESKTKNNISYFYSDPAKTYLDKVYFGETNSLIRVKNTQKYSKRYPKWVGKRLT